MERDRVSDPVQSRTLIGGANRLMVVSPYRAVRIQKEERG
jgi:hypothetical protein